jgi:hypothetical protein
MHSYNDGITETFNANHLMRQCLSNRLNILYSDKQTRVWYSNDIFIGYLVFHDSHTEFVYRDQVDPTLFRIEPKYKYGKYFDQITYSFYTNPRFYSRCLTKLDEMYYMQYYSFWYSNDDIVGHCKWIGYIVTIDGKKEYVYRDQVDPTLTRIEPWPVKEEEFDTYSKKRQPTTEIINDNCEKKLCIDNIFL